MLDTRCWMRETRDEIELTWMDYVSVVNHGYPPPRAQVTQINADLIVLTPACGCAGAHPGGRLELRAWILFLGF
ncbi:MAG: hypothetical protein WAV28_14640 [Sedimentisphaerales bacterium]